MQEADLEVSKLSKQNTSLRDTIQRLDREKMLQEAKWKSHLKVTSRIRMRGGEALLPGGCSEDDRAGREGAAPAG